MFADQIDTTRRSHDETRFTVKATVEGCDDSILQDPRAPELALQYNDSAEMRRPELDRVHREIDMLVDGSCHCGAIRFEAEIDPKRVGICHCTDCQTFSGGPFRTSVFVAEENFRQLAGSPAVYEKTAESGSTRSLVFCSACGTHVWGTSPGSENKFYSVRVGSLKQRAELPPVAQVWCQSKLPWVDDLSSVHRIETQ
jgi:hypothetical protein